MSWYNALGSYSRACLGSIGEEDNEQDEMIFIFAEAHHCRLTHSTVGYEDFEAIMADVPPQITKFINDLGVTYSRVEGTVRGGHAVVGIKIKFNSELTSYTARELHVCINIPRYLSEQSDRYAAYKYLNSKYSLGISPFEGMLLSHGFSMWNSTSDSLYFIRPSYPTDQTMFNGWKTCTKLGTILGRTFDVVFPDRTSNILDGVVYWQSVDETNVINLIKDPKDYLKDSDTFHLSYPFADFLVLRSGDNEVCPERNIFLSSLKTCSLILRKYMEELSNVMVH